ncbi:unnamed protein product, partial [marine sediment metagenome]
NMNEYNEPFYIFIPTLFDSSLAPKNVHILEILTEFPYRFKNIKNWLKIKQDMQQKIIKKLETILGPIEEFLFYVDSATPKT